MAEPWPAGLPPIPMLPVSMGFADGVIRTEGVPAKARQVTTATAEPLRFRILMTYTQLQEFRAFWDALGGRAMPFTHYWPLTKEAAEMRFTALPEFQAHGKDLWEVSLECEKLP